MTKKMLLVDPRILESHGSQAPPVPDATSQSIRELDEEMRNVLDQGELDFENKTKMYNQALWRYLRRIGQYREKPLGYVNLKTPEHTVVDESQQVISNEPVASSLMEKEVLRSVPNSMQKKAERLLSLVKTNPDLKWNDRGEIFFQGQLIKNSNLVDLVNDVLRRRKRTGKPTGWQTFATALRNMNVAQDLIGHPDRWNYIQSQKLPTSAGKNRDDESFNDQGPSFSTPQKGSSGERNVALTSIKRMKHTEATKKADARDLQTPFGPRDKPYVRRRRRKHIKKEGKRLDWAKSKLNAPWETV